MVHVEKIVDTFVIILGSWNLLYHHAFPAKAKIKQTETFCPAWKPLRFDKSNDLCVSFTLRNSINLLLAQVLWIYRLVWPVHERFPQLYFNFILWSEMMPLYLALLVLTAVTVVCELHDGIDSITPAMDSLLDFRALPHLEQRDIIPTCHHEVDHSEIGHYEVRSFYEVLLTLGAGWEPYCNRDHLEKAIEETCRSASVQIDQPTGPKWKDDRCRYRFSAERFREVTRAGKVIGYEFVKPTTRYNTDLKCVFDALVCFERDFNRGLRIPTRCLCLFSY